HQDFRKRIGSYSKGNFENTVPEQDTEKLSHTADLAIEEENPYLQNNATIEEETGSQEETLVQNAQNEPIALSMELDNNRVISTLEKENDIPPDLVLAPRDELAALYSSTE